MADPLFACFLPSLVDPLWFQVDTACDDDAEITKLEEKHKEMV